MPQPNRASPPPPEAPNRTIHYVGLAVLLVVLIVLIVVA
jgi:hypothetical protein